MLNRINTLLENPTTRHYIRVVAFVVLGASVGAMLMFKAYPYLHSQILLRNNPTTEEITKQESIAEASSTYALPRSGPVSMRIPSIHLDTTFEEPLGLNKDKTVQTPESFEKVGWYKYGSAPGELGPSVILGHVDSYQGPAVFYSLGQLKSGDKIYITREDGKEAVFEVMYFERYKQEDFPTALVYGPVPYPALRLITCTGVYDHGKKQYSHNLVVYAKLVAPEATSTTSTEAGN